MYRRNYGETKHDRNSEFFVGDPALAGTGDDDDDDMEEGGEAVDDDPVDPPDDDTVRNPKRPIEELPPTFVLGPDGSDSKILKIVYTDGINSGPMYNSTGQYNWLENMNQTINFTADVVESLQLTAMAWMADKKHKTTFTDISVNIGFLDALLPTVQQFYSTNFGGWVDQNWPAFAWFTTGYMLLRKIDWALSSVAGQAVITALKAQLHAGRAELRQLHDVVYHHDLLYQFDADFDLVPMSNPGMANVQVVGDYWEVSGDVMVPMNESIHFDRNWEFSVKLKYTGGTGDNSWFKIEDNANGSVLAYFGSSTMMYLSSVVDFPSSVLSTYSGFPQRMTGSDGTTYMQILNSSTSYSQGTWFILSVEHIYTENIDFSTGSVTNISTFKYKINNTNIAEEQLEVPVGYAQNWTGIKFSGSASNPTCVEYVRLE